MGNQPETIIEIDAALMDNVREGSKVVSIRPGRRDYPLGPALVRDSGLGLTIVGAVMGAVLFRLLVAVALRWGLNPNDLKLVTAVFVFVALVVPRIPGRFRKKAAGVANA